MTEFKKWPKGNQRKDRDAPLRLLALIEVPPVDEALDKDGNHVYSFNSYKKWALGIKVTSSDTHWLKVEVETESGTLVWETEEDVPRIARWYIGGLDPEVPWHLVRET